jgi:hypothetical protein
MVCEEVSSTGRYGGQLDIDQIEFYQWSSLPGGTRSSLGGGEMKRTIGIVITIVLILSVAAVGIVYQVRATGTTYYVDMTGGNDSNTGLATDQAWKTISKVNGAAITSGDSVLFKRGETWTGTTLTAVSGVTYDDYGSGALPILDGQSTIDVITISSKSYVTISDLEIKNAYDFGVYSAGASYVTLNNLIVHNCGNDCISFMAGSTHNTVNGGTVYTTTRRDGTSAPRSSSRAWISPMPTP